MPKKKSRKGYRRTIHIYKSKPHSGWELVHDHHTTAASARRSAREWHSEGGHQAIVRKVDKDPWGEKAYYVYSNYRPIEKGETPVGVKYKKIQKRKKKNGNGGSFGLGGNTPYGELF